MLRIQIRLSFVSTSLLIEELEHFSAADWAKSCNNCLWRDAPAVYFMKIFECILLENDLTNKKIVTYILCREFHTHHLITRFCEKLAIDIEVLTKYFFFDVWFTIFLYWGDRKFVKRYFPNSAPQIPLESRNSSWNTFFENRFQKNSKIIT